MSKGVTSEQILQAIYELSAEFKQELQDTKTEMRQELQDTKTELKQEIQDTKTELRQEFKQELAKTNEKIDIFDEKLSILTDSLMTTRAEVKILKKSI